MLKQPAQKPRSRRLRPVAKVVDLGEHRQQKRRAITERRVRAVIDECKHAVTKLFASGLVFTQKGSRSARDLLHTHQRLVRAVDLIARLGEEHVAADPRIQRRAEALFSDLDQQLAQAVQQNARAGEFVSRRGRD